MTSPPEKGNAPDCQGGSDPKQTTTSEIHKPTPAAGLLSMPAVRLAIEYRRDTIETQIATCRAAMRAWRGPEGERLVRYGYTLTRVWPSGTRNTMYDHPSRLFIERALIATIHFTRNRVPAWPNRRLITFLFDNGEQIEPEAGA